VLIDKVRDLLRDRFGRLSEEEARRRLALKYAAFKRLVDANTAALEVMADMQAKATGEFLFDRAYVDESFARLSGLTSSVVQDLQELSGHRHKGLRAAMEQVAVAARQTAGEPPRQHGGPVVMSMASVNAAPLELVGGKVQRLGEITTEVGLPVPDGFCVTTAACGLYLEQKGLLGTIGEHIAKISLKDKEELNGASHAIKAAIMGASWPDAVGRAILEAYDALERRVRTGTGHGLRVSVRSSAVGEDGDFSFAGQFDTVLNVGRDALLRTCQEVLASEFGPRALVYFKARGVGAGVLPMAIGVIAMLDARASGVLYTRDPQKPESDALVVAGLWGLGSLAVDGSVNPDVFTLSRDPEPALRDTKVSAKSRMLLCRETTGLVEVEVPGWMRDQPCLNKDQVSLLGAYGKRLEEHFSRPQDVEWAVDADDNLFILQSRPLRVTLPERPGEDVMALRQGLIPLMRGGVVACRGCAAGPVHLLASEEEVRLVPPGAVVVAKTASPKLAEALDRAAAIVTDAGSTASHLATVAREFGIPSIFGAPSATTLLKPGMVVTVDADLGNVYEGRAEVLLEGAAKHPAHAEESPLLKRFRASLAHVTPLNLTDPRSPGFKASKCRTLHDILRFAHEMAVEELFLAGSLASKGTRHALRLKSTLPVDFFFIDLGGGLGALPEGGQVTPESFECRPLIPLWRGMVQAPWRTDAAAGAGDMASLFANTMAARDALEQAASPNFVIVSEAYLNLSFRLGYHFSRVDAYLSGRAEDNYASFLFHGGAANLAGKARRVRFLAGALEAAGFHVHHREDALFARAGHAQSDEMDHRLEDLGRLLVITRQADTLFGDEADVDRAIAAYRAGDYFLGLGPAVEGGS
jgi:pyruvate,water dikinase